MSSVSGPLLAIGGVIVGAVLNNFFGEDYRRHKDSTALAAALAGELKGHIIGARGLADHLRHIAALLDPLADPDTKLVFRKSEMPNDPIFAANAGKIGILGRHLAHEAALAYQMIAAYRHVHKVVMDAWDEMTTDEKFTRVTTLLDLIDSNVERGEKTIQGLEHYSESGTFAGWVKSFSLWQFATKRAST